MTSSSETGDGIFLDKPRIVVEMRVSITEQHLKMIATASVLSRIVLKVRPSQTTRKLFGGPAGNSRPLQSPQSSTAFCKPKTEQWESFWILPESTMEESVLGLKLSYFSKGLNVISNEARAIFYRGVQIVTSIKIKLKKSFYTHLISSR